MQRRLETLLPCLQMGIMSEKMAYLVSENLSKKYCDEAIALIQSRATKFSHILKSVKKLEKKMNLYSQKNIKNI